MTVKRVIGLLTSALVIGAGLGIAPARAQTTACAHPVEAYAGGGGTTGDDPLLARQWALDQINAPEAWAQGAGGLGAVVATIDTGIDLTHPEFAGRVLDGADLVGIEDCPGPQDEAGHGTGVAGIIAAAADNGIGIAGVAPEAQLLPFRVWTGATAPNWTAMTEAVIRAADAGVDVINISIYTNLRDPSDESGESPLAKALDYAWEKGAVIVAAAGNDSRPYCSWPARHPRVVCAAATDRSGEPAFYSHLPVHPDGVGVAAPGGTADPQSVVDPSIGCENDDRVWITIWPGSKNDCGPGFAGYDTGTGTSWATAHVSGVAALLAGAGMGNKEIVECLKMTSSNKGSYDPATGYGSVDAEAAVSTCVKGPVGPEQPPPSGNGSGLPGPRVRLGVSDLSPERGESVVFRVRLGRCEGHEGTIIKLQTKRHGSFATTSEKNLSGDCRARFTRKARFAERTYRALWPEQDDDHRLGRSRAKVVRTH
ncbi:MAG TPA: S8 family serine peptidase [Actinomycetota bacterium]|nr:S8 family serine peptidase [Actinomycetota bacterium]